MPTNFDTVIVFGDSLSDIGRKWGQPMGWFADHAGLMTVNQTGRFSDCRNWTDFMFEEAAQASLITTTANASKSLSKRHTSISPNALFQPDNAQLFQYANYAVGGACGDKATTGLTTFKEQVEEFQTDYQRATRPLGNVLIFIWFGANDLFTTGRPGTEMNQVAKRLIQLRDKLSTSMHRDLVGEKQFVFMGLCSPMSAARYTSELQAAQQQLLRATNTPKDLLDTLTDGYGNLATYASRRLTSKVLLEWSDTHDTGGAHARSQYRKLKQQLEKINLLQQGVQTFNSLLSHLAKTRYDLFVDIGDYLTEEALNKGLIPGVHSGAQGFDPADFHRRPPNMQYINCIRTPANICDGAHPSDRVYNIIWQEIRRALVGAGYSFGHFNATAALPVAAPAAAQRARVDDID